MDIQYVCAASKSNLVDVLFEPDSPPPIWPSSVDRQSLLTKQLYLVARSVSLSQGLVYISAKYAGALYRTTERVLRKTQLDSPRDFSFVSSPYTLTRQNPDNFDLTASAGNLTNSYSYTYRPIVHVNEYTEVGNTPTATIAKPSVQETYSLITYGGGYYAADPANGWSAIKFVKYTRDFFENRLNSYVIQEDRTETYITQSVKTVVVRFYIN